VTGYSRNKAAAQSACAISAGSDCFFAVDLLYSVGDARTGSLRKIVTKRPNVVISTRDAERLDALVQSLGGRSFPGKTELEAELARADVVEPKDVPPTVVTMNSTVKFRVASSKDQFQLTLVYPKDVDESGGTISVLAPVGSALLGLSQGDEIEWPKPGGGLLKVRIQEIVYQPERAGEYHR
jgi:regulator of nucleoside diphosphate kinase